jgi:hypothetical protein
MSVNGMDNLSKNSKKIQKNSKFSCNKAPVMLFLYS